MRKKQVWRYYCEYCGKSKGSLKSMELHESGCTKNPQRVCRLCEDSSPASLDWAVSYLKRACTDAEYDLYTGELHNADTVRRELSEALSGCPVCMLAAIRQADTYSNRLGFDYMSECRSYYGDKADARRQHYEP